MGLPDPPERDCPMCGAHSWSWTEVSVWGGHMCDECGTDVLHAGRDW